MTSTHKPTREVAPGGAYDPLADFSGRMIVGVSDADMVSAAYEDGLLGPEQGRDTLFVLRLDQQLADATIAEVGAVNSVTGTGVIAVSPDGLTAIVVETVGERPEGRPDATVQDLAPGRTITVIDLSDPDRPTVTQTIECPIRPEAVSISSDGSLVAVCFGIQGFIGPDGAGGETPLAIYPLRQGRLGDPFFPVIPGWTLGHVLQDLQFAPDGDTMVLANGTTPALHFVRVLDGGATLEAWGNPVAIQKAPVLVRYAPDGRHVLVNGSYTGADVLLRSFGAPRGSVSSIRVAAETEPDGSPLHQLVSHATVGVIPEGLAVSPDMQWVATSNCERTMTALDSPAHNFHSSLTLLRFDAETGRLNRVGDFPFDGTFSETVLFDNSSRFLASTSYETYDGERRGRVDFWRLVVDPFDPERVSLVRSAVSVPVVRGLHQMVIVR